MTQKHFDFNRAIQLRTLETCVIPAARVDTDTGAGLSRNSGTLKAILKALDSYQRDRPNCFPSIAALARNTGLSERSVQRGIRRLTSPEIAVLIITERVGHTTLYKIDWGKLLDLVPRETNEGGDNFRQGGDNLSPPGASSCHPGGCQVVTHKRPHRNDQLKRPSFSCGDVNSSSGRDVSTERTKAPKQFWGRPGDLTRADLRDFRTLTHLFEFTLARGWGDLKRSEVDRLKFFALCIYVADRGDHPGKCLTDAVKNKRYGNILAHHEDAAAEIIRRARGPVAPLVAGLAMKTADTGEGPRRDVRAELQRMAATERASR